MANLVSSHTAGGGNDRDPRHPVRPRHRRWRSHHRAAHPFGPATLPDLRRPVSGGVMNDPVRAWVYSAITFSIVPAAWLVIGTLILRRCF